MILLCFFCKDSVFLCIKHENGEKIQEKFGVLTDELECMRDLMLSEGVVECAMERYEHLPDSCLACA